MIEVTIIRPDGEWSSVNISPSVAMIVTNDGTTTDIDVDTAWNVVSYAQQHPSQYTVVWQ